MAGQDRPVLPATRNDPAGKDAPVGPGTRRRRRVRVRSSADRRRRTAEFLRLAPIYVLAAIVALAVTLWVTSDH